MVQLARLVYFGRYNRRQIRSLRTGPVSEPVVTHVLENDLAVIVGVPTRVLVRPLHVEDGTSVVIETTHIVASSIVVLSVAHPREERRRGVNLDCTQ